MRFLRTMQLLIGLLAGWFAIFIAAPALGILQLHYPRAFENDPLHAPVVVQSVSENTLTLADGRIFKVGPHLDGLDDAIRASHFRVDLITEGHATDRGLYVAERHWICGTPWAALIEIPIFPDDIPINRRRFVGQVHQVQ